MITALSKTDMRDAFFTVLFDIAKIDRDIIILSNDFGAPSLDRFRAELPGQFINAAISEQNMVSTAAGLALSGKKPIVYSIATFITLRALEQIKIDLCTMNLPVAIIGVGAGYAYSTDGPTHHATEDIGLLRSLAHMTILSPSEPGMAAVWAPLITRLTGPTYLRFDRGKWPVFAEGAAEGHTAGLRVLRPGNNLALISTGIMVHQALKAAEALAASGLSVRVVDLYRLKPLNEPLLAQVLADVSAVATLEEHTRHGGLGGLVAEMMADAGIVKPLKRLAIDDVLLYAYGERSSLHAQCGLDVAGIVDTLTRWSGR